MPRSKIAGLGFYVPKNVVTNDDLAQRIDTSDEWIRERSGIQERRYFTPGEDTVANMGARAAQMALDRAGLKAEDIDFIIFATLNPDYFFPGSGVLLQRELGINHLGTPALDIRNQCSGFIYGLSIADQFIKTGMYKNVLMVGSEIHSSGLDFSDEGRAVTVLFGDGAGAVVLSATDEEDKGILTTKLHADGEQAEKLAVLAPTANEERHISKEMIDDRRVFPVMNGRYVFKFAVEKFPEVIMEALNETGYKTEDIDLFVPHQANLRIAEAVRKTLGLPPEKVHNNIMKYGNTTAASIPIALNEAWELGKVKEGDLVCLAAFGSGFTWASALIRW
ncbi:beta-ketoacyl-ACP synthase III [Pontibacter sp. G13]|uniref:3-oxoacyl-ACP synthase III family protein n=1 Tax=Pontibacter sp. G13 TaxID=3074898 RepID=UPI0028898DD3|nr:beta-ketoacyl-ACP synthase III [Pontibacter sp. G13]WNJ20954.1 beta-ketoacyl-ACP synthase III [Pontibacter sp. G13]